jgi:hypothetical protein
MHNSKESYSRTQHGSRAMAATAYVSKFIVTCYCIYNQFHSSSYGNNKDFIIIL